MRPIGARHALTPAQQYLFLRKSPLCRGAGSLGPQGLAWQCDVRPTPVSRAYTISIVYKFGEAPQVFVVSPSLETLAAGRDIPHVYRNPTRLCLYLPGSGEWESHMLIATTFVPWTMTWLFYFEEWLWSDDWKGGGAHPDPADSERGNRRLRRASTRSPASA